VAGIGHVLPDSWSFAHCRVKGERQLVRSTCCALRRYLLDADGGPRMRKSSLDCRQSHDGAPESELFIRHPGGQVGTEVAPNRYPGWWQFP